MLNTERKGRMNCESIASLVLWGSYGCYNDLSVHTFQYCLCITILPIDCIHCFGSHCMRGSTASLHYWSSSRIFTCIHFLYVLNSLSLFWFSSAITWRLSPVCALSSQSLHWLLVWVFSEQNPIVYAIFLRFLYFSRNILINLLIKTKIYLVFVFIWKFNEIRVNSKLFVLIVLNVCTHRLICRRLQLEKSIFKLFDRFVSIEEIFSLFFTWILCLKS